MLRSLPTALSVLTLGLFSSIPLQAKNPQVEWIFSGGGAKSDKIRGVTTDKAGNVFLTGETLEDGKFGHLERKGYGSTDAFLLKLSAEGKPLWIQSIGGSLVDRGYGVATDQEGNVYVTGHHQSTDGKIGDQDLPNTGGDYDLFLAKYDTNGKLLWVRTVGSAGYDYSHGVVVDSKGDIIIGGCIADAVEYGDAKITGKRAMFVSKYKSNGDLAWVRHTEERLSGSAHGVVVDGADNIYLGGSAFGTGTFGKQKATLPKQAAVVAKLSPAGEVQWLKAEPSTVSGGYHEIGCDVDGRVYAAGIFKGSLTIGGQTYETSSDKDGNGVIAHYSTDGELKWHYDFNSEKTDYALGVITDEERNVYFTGEHSDGAKFMGKSLPSLGGTDIYTVAFNAKGERLWIELMGGPKADNAYCMAYHQGSVFFAGSCVGPIDFGKKSLGETQAADLYVAKMKVK